MSKKKKLSSLEDLGGLVYSTNPEENLEEEDATEKTIAPNQQKLEAHLEKKGRGGKAAIIIKGFVGSEEDLKDLGKSLKSHCATGGSVKNGEIIIQGKMREKAMQFLKNKGYSVKRVGG
jgi:translation initiation factor 1